MNNTIFYLSTCDTCKKIMSRINDLDQFELIDIKKSNITAIELDRIRLLSDLDYSALFNRRARKFKNIVREGLSSKDYRQLIIEEYTFLKRPVIIFNKQVFVGNSPKVIGKMLDWVNS